MTVSDNARQLGPEQIKDCRTEARWCGVISSEIPLTPFAGIGDYFESPLDNWEHDQCWCQTVEVS